MKTFLSLGFLLAVLLFSGPGHADPSAGKQVAPPNPLERWDPLGPVNRRIYRFNAGFDRWVLLPVVEGYRFVVPTPARKAARNFFDNLDQVTVFANCVLQLDLPKGVTTLGRFIVNTTVGIGGLWDPASLIDVPSYTEDFGLTLGRYGVGEGPYLVLPLLGPSSLRAGTGLVADRLMLWGVEAGILGDLTIVLSAVFPVEVMVQRDAASFVYGELGPFEYELVRYLYLEYRDALLTQ
ncbi:MAG: VacJ family lipoprotein [Myxococcota bacterium]|nr:VacJ family lipoprotein [Myxococcota bacterium]